ncbi:hypothetical protein BA768_09965 [Chryseobacterium sp. CBo1]|uniref:MliC family protein n=1 Tax=Chryseobacterium sp. CBo1 TaxID=1869230 RepID=UPI0008106E6F|nr:MliC family protein [Chryseobacterium sp. CBo1]OCK52954.1 hypothetical protein BA768_09965 [Chryseobacterium sp. CBo1]
MIKKTIIIASLSIFTITTFSCTKEVSKKSESYQKVNNTVDALSNNQITTDEIVKSKAKDNQGKAIDMTFNNTKDMVTVIFEGNKIEMKAQKTASGIWYSNKAYDLRGQGSHVELYKNRTKIFDGN